MKKFMLIFVVLLSACTFQTKHRGYVFPADLENVVADIKTTTQLQNEIGAPQVKTIYGDEVWIYYGADENYRGPLPLKYDNQTVLLAWVDGTRVREIRVLHDADLPDVMISEDETEIPAAIELNAIQELFNNAVSKYDTITGKRDLDDEKIFVFCDCCMFGGHRRGGG